MENEVSDVGLYRKRNGKREREDGRFMGLITSGWVHVLFGLVGSQLYNIK